MKILTTLASHYRQCLGKQPTSEAAIGNQAPDAETVDKLFFLSNWRVDQRELPRFQILGAGELLEPLTSSLFKAIGRKFPSAKVGWSWDADNREAQSRPLRMVDHDSPGHVVATDIHLFQKNGDLFIGYSGKAWSKSRFWMRAFGFVILPAIFIGLMTWVVTEDGFRKSWVRDFAKKHAATKSVSYSTPGADGRSTSESFTAVEPLENYIEHGTAPTGEQAFLYLQSLMIKEVRSGNDLSQVFNQYIERFEQRFKNTDPSPHLGRAQALMHGGLHQFESELCNIGVFPPDSGEIQLGGFRSAANELNVRSYIETQFELKSFPRSSKPFPISRQTSFLSEQELQNMASDYIERQRLARQINGLARQREVALQSNYKELRWIDGLEDPKLTEAKWEYQSIKSKDKERVSCGLKLNAETIGRLDYTPLPIEGLNESEVNIFFAARKQLGLLEPMSGDDQIRAIYEDPKMKQACIKWIICANKTRVPGLRSLAAEVMGTHESYRGFQIAGSLLMFASFEHDFDALLAALPPKLQHEFHFGMKKAVEKPWTILELARRDWTLFLSGPVKVPAMIFACLMGLTLFLPKSALRVVCDLMKWPSPQTFDQAISAQNTSLQGLVSTILRGEYRLTEDRIIRVR